MPRSNNHQLGNTPQHRRQQSSGVKGFPVSDYETDFYAEARNTLPPPDRTNTELNLQVLRRYLPSIRTILSIAANGVVYRFNSESEAWTKSDMEGTLFICELRGTSVTGTGHPRCCVFILNRRGLDNTTIALDRVCDFEESNNLLIFREEIDDASSDPAVSHGSQPALSQHDPVKFRVLGLWIHADRDDTRRINTALIEELWRRARQAGQGQHAVIETSRENGLTPASQNGLNQTSTQPPPRGRRVSMSELFALANTG